MDEDDSVLEIGASAATMAHPPSTHDNELQQFENQRLMRVGVKRSFSSLQHAESFDDDLPTLHPTLITLKADLVLKVVQNGTPVGRIMLHKAHICDNIPYFKGMFREQSAFLEADKDKNEHIFACPYSLEIVNEYFKTVYGTKIDITYNNCIALHWIADYFNDQGMLQRCTCCFEEHMDEGMAFKLLAYTDKYNTICANFFKLNGIIDVHSATYEIEQMPYKQIKWLLLEIGPFVLLRIMLELILTWLVKQESSFCFGLITKIDVSNARLVDRFAIYNACRAKLKRFPLLEERVYKHLFADEKPELLYLSPLPSTDSAFDIEDIRDPLHALHKQTFMIHRSDDTILRIDHSISRGQALIWVPDRHLAKVDPYEEFSAICLTDGRYMILTNPDDAGRRFALSLSVVHLNPGYGPKVPVILETASMKVDAHNKRSWSVPTTGPIPLAFWRVIAFKDGYFKLSIGYSSKDGVNDTRTLGGTDRLTYCQSKLVEESDHYLRLMRTSDDHHDD